MTEPADHEHDDGMRQLTRQLFGREPETPETVDLGQPKPKSTNHVPGEGDNPEAPPISDEAVMRDWVHRMFDADYAAYQQHPDGIAPPYPL